MYLLDYCHPSDKSNKLIEQPRFLGVVSDKTSMGLVSPVATVITRKTRAGTYQVAFFIIYSLGCSARKITVYEYFETKIAQKAVKLKAI